MPAIGYQIRANGHLRPEWTEWFDEMGIHHRADGTRILSGLVRDLGLELLEVSRVEPAQKAATVVGRDILAVNLSDG